MTEWQNERSHNSARLGGVSMQVCSGRFSPANPMHYLTEFSTEFGFCSSRVLDERRNNASLLVYEFMWVYFAAI